MRVSGVSQGRLIGFMLLVTNLLVHRLFGWAAVDGVRGWVANLPFVVALPLIILAADLVQYWTHRAYGRSTRWVTA